LHTNENTKYQHHKEEVMAIVRILNPFRMMLYAIMGNAVDFARIDD